MNKAPIIRKRIFDPETKEPYLISRSKIELFIECPKCFYLDRRLGLGRPSWPVFSLNNAVDTLLKKEFDLLRKNGKSHDLMKKYHIDAIPLNHPKIPIWRDDINNYLGASAFDKKSNFIVTGIVDDVWKDKAGNLIIVDYKATSTTREISLDDHYKKSYKRQMEIYQWIFQKMGFKVSNMGYFVFANATKNKPNFESKLEFILSIIPYKGKTDWIEAILLDIKRCLMSDFIPKANANCEHCFYRDILLSTHHSLKNILKKGESIRAEFKSSMRWDYIRKQVNKELEMEVIKTIAAFANTTHGGTLLIGVKDDGSIIGVEQDILSLGKGSTFDKYERAFTNAVINYLGRDVRYSIELELTKIKNRLVLQVNVPPLDSPTFLINRSNTEFYLRIGNSSQTLNVKETHEYINKRWSGT